MATTRTPNRSGYFAIPTAPDFLLEIAKGQMPGYEPVRIIGNNPNLDTAYSTVWAVEDTSWTPLATPTELFLSSTSINDTQTIFIDALDEEFNSIQIFRQLNGQNPVSAGTIFRVNTMANVSQTELEGAVHLAEAGPLVGGVPTDPTLNQDVIPFYTIAGRSGVVSATSVYTVPADKTMFMIVGRTYVSPLGTADSIEICLTREFSAQFSPGVIFCGHLGDGAGILPVGGFLRFEEMTTIMFSGKATNPGIRVALSQDAVLIDNDQF